MKQSIFYKILWGYFLIIFLFAAIVITVSMSVVRAHSTRELEIRLAYETELVVAAATLFMQVGDYESIERIITETRHDHAFQFAVLSTNGEIIAGDDFAPDNEHASNGEGFISNLLGGNAGSAMNQLRVPIVSDSGQTLGVVIASVAPGSPDTLARAVGIRIILVTAICIVLSIALAFGFTRVLVAPINTLRDASANLANGDFATRVSFRTDDELGELALGFNHMAEEVGRFIDDANAQHEELTRIMQSINEGLLVLDAAGRVKLVNKSIEHVLNTDEATGHYYWDVIESEMILDIINTIRARKTNTLREIDSDGRVILVSASFMESNEDLIIITHDVTDIRNLEQMKKDFVANVSHELRTPLTAVKGFIETLEDRVKGKNRHYIKIIKRNTNRLISIVKDLLILSSLEDESSALLVDETDVVQLMKNTLRIFRARAKKDGLELVFEVADGFPQRVHIDSFKIEQVIVNLVDNALKYTENGTVTIRLDSGTNYIYLIVEDSGPGIPKDDLPRIFERFYVVDKSRSRQLGGTGLGLSIVRHIVRLHKGDIMAKSEPGVGTKFTVRLPRGLSRQKTA